MKHLSVGISDELWTAFINTYAIKNETTRESAEHEAPYEARDIMSDAIKAYVLDEQNEEEVKQDTCARVSDLPLETKRTLFQLLRIVDNVSLGEIAKTIGDEYVGNVLYELYAIRQELKDK